MLRATTHGARRITVVRTPIVSLALALEDILAFYDLNTASDNDASRRSTRKTFVSTLAGPQNAGTNSTVRPACVFHV
jgi:hypothetical protein